MHDMVRNDFKLHYYSSLWFDAAQDGIYDISFVELHVSDLKLMRDGHGFMRYNERMCATHSVC